MPKGEHLFKHGLCYTLTYKKWASMMSRTRNASEYHKRYYTNRKIGVCLRWEKFMNFYADMGECPVGLTLERIDNDKSYSPSNCRWATIVEQANNRRNNRRLIYRNKEYTLNQLAKLAGVTPHCLSRRLFRGHSVEYSMHGKMRGSGQR